MVITFGALKIRRASALGGSTPPPGTNLQARVPQALTTIRLLGSPAIETAANCRCDAGVAGRERKGE